MKNKQANRIRKQTSEMAENMGLTPKEAKKLYRATKKEYVRNSAAEKESFNRRAKRLEDS